MNKIIHSLKNIGLSELESNVYITLLRESKATGYQLAKYLSKPVSNVYKALTTLSNKGLVHIDESKTPKECLPVQIGEYFDSLENSLKNNRSKIENELKYYKAMLPREGIYQIDKIDQIVERGNKIIDSASKIIMLDGSPRSLSLFRTKIEEKAAEGLKILIKKYDSTIFEGCDFVASESTEKSLEWKFDWLDVIADNSEFMLTVFDINKENVSQAVWSKSAYISTVLVSGFIHEFIHTKITNTIYAKKSSSDILSELKRLHKEYFYNLPLFEEMNSQFFPSK